MTNTKKTTDCPSDGKRGAKAKLPLLVHCVWSLYCSGFVWRFFLFRCYLLGATVPCPTSGMQTKGTSGMICRPTVLPRSQARPPLPFWVFFLLFLFSVLPPKRNCSAVGGGGSVSVLLQYPYMHVSPYLLPVCGFVAEICLGGVKQRFKSIRSYVSPSKKRGNAKCVPEYCGEKL